MIAIGVSAVLSAENTDAHACFRHLFDLGIRHIVIKPVRAAPDQPHGLLPRHLDTVKKGYDKLFDLLSEKTLADELDYIKAVLQPIDYAGRFIAKVLLANTYTIQRCGAGEQILAVTNAGQAHICDSFAAAGAEPLGSVFTGMDEKRRRIPRVADAEPGKCDRCWAAYLCGGVCKYTRYISKCFPEFECGLNRHIIERAVRFRHSVFSRLERAREKDIRRHLKAAGFPVYPGRGRAVYSVC